MDQKIRFFTLLETTRTQSWQKKKKSCLSILIANMIKDGHACFISHLAALFSHLKAVLELWHLEETNKVGVGGHKVDERQRDIVQ